MTYRFCNSRITLAEFLETYCHKPEGHAGPCETKQDILGNQSFMRHFGKYLTRKV